MKNQKKGEEEGEGEGEDGVDLGEEENFGEIKLEWFACIEEYARSEDGLGCGFGGAQTNGAN